MILTYDDDHLVHDEGDGMYGIRIYKHHVQALIKRVRQRKTRLKKKYDKAKIYPDQSFIKPLKYFAVGEYGTRNHRPHYHIICFNLPMDLVPKSFQEAWPYGKIHFGMAEKGSIHYTAKYLLKDESFLICSNGIGKKYIIKNRVYHEKDSVEYVTMDGFKYKIPRYYKDQIDIYQEKTHIEVGQKPLYDLPNMTVNGDARKEKKLYESDLRYAKEAIRLAKQGFLDPEHEIQKRILHQDKNLTKNINEKF